MESPGGRIVTPVSVLEVTSLVLKFTVVISVGTNSVPASIHSTEISTSTSLIVMGPVTRGGIHSVMWTVNPTVGISRLPEARGGVTQKLLVLMM